MTRRGQSVICEWCMKYAGPCGSGPNPRCHNCGAPVDERIFIVPGGHIHHLIKQNTGKGSR